MLLRIWRYVTLLLAALGLVMGGAHLLELPVRVQYEPAFYMRVTSTLYRFFGLAGGPLQVLAVLAALGLAWLTRARRSFRFTLAGALCLTASLLLWFALVQPVNAAWLEALRAGPGDAVLSYAAHRNRWEAGHAAAFLAWLAGYMLLLQGSLGENPRGAGRAGG